MAVEMGRKAELIASEPLEAQQHHLNRKVTGKLQFMTVTDDVLLKCMTSLITTFSEELASKIDSKQPLEGEGRPRAQGVDL